MGWTDLHALPHGSDASEDLKTPSVLMGAFTEANVRRAILNRFLDVLVFNRPDRGRL